MRVDLCGTTLVGLAATWCCWHQKDIGSGLAWFESLSREVDGSWLQLLDLDVIKSSQVS